MGLNKFMSVNVFKNINSNPGVVKRCRRLSRIPEHPTPAMDLDTKKTDSAVKSADRVLDILQLLARQGSALSHHEIGTSLGIPKSSLTHLLRNLVAREFLSLDPGPGTY